MSIYQTVCKGTKNIAHTQAIAHFLNVLLVLTEVKEQASCHLQH